MTRSLRRIVALSLLGATAAVASVVLDLSVEQMAQRAELIARGTVGPGSAIVTRGGRILTETRVEVSQRYKGASPAEITVVSLGGESGGMGQQVSGEVTFREGEEVVLFLNVRGPQSYRVVGLSQGKFVVDRSEALVRATQSTPGLGRVSHPGGAIEDKRPLTLSLTELEGRITAATR